MCARVEKMFEVLGGLIVLLVVAIYSAVVVGKRTDQRIVKLLTEDREDVPMQVGFPEDVMRLKERPTRGTIRAGKQSV